MAKIVIGGQAVIEGVLMRAPNNYAVAVRKPDGKISIRTTEHIPLAKRKKILGLPFMRGIIVLYETIVLGSKALTYSANESVGEEEEKLSKKELVFTFVISIVFALLIFKFLPLLLANILSKNAGLNNFWFNIIDGTIKIAIFVIYLLAISLMKDVQRIFEYHGAEHMTVHCYEAKKKLTIENVRKYKTMHPRCGTEFLLLVFLISIVFYMFIPFGTNFWIKYVFRLLLLPIIAGVSYEVLRISGKYYKNWFFRIIAAPGMMLQKITTNKPDDRQIAVAIESLNAALKAEQVYLKK